MLSQFSINPKSVNKIQDESGVNMRKNHTCAVLYRIVKKITDFIIKITIV